MTDLESWQPIESHDRPKDGRTAFLAAIHHGQAGYIVCEATGTKYGVHHVAEGSCVGWRPGHKHPAFWMPMPEFSSPAPGALPPLEGVRAARMSPAAPDEMGD